MNLQSVIHPREAAELGGYGRSGGSGSRSDGASGGRPGGVAGGASGDGRASARADRAALTRERAAALFGGSPPVPAPPPLPGVPVFGAGPFGRLRGWLFVRCGLEFRTVVALAVVLAVACGLAVRHYWAARPRTVRVPAASAAAVVTPMPVVRAAATPPAAARVTVDVAGKVAKPGLRRLPKGSRVADALTAAGGPLPGTDTTALNLARQLVDGEQILVGLPAAAPAAGPGPDSPSAPLSLSTATEPQLDALPGVGPVLAQHILAFRTQHGGFTSLQQLRQIPGIGPRKFATLRPLLQP